MESLSLQEEKLIQDIRNLFRQRKKLKQLKVEYLEILRIFLSINNFWSNKYIEYESNGDRNKTLSVEEYFNKISPYLKYIINNLKKSDT